MVGLLIATVLGIVLGSYLYLIRVQNITVIRAQTWNAAMAVAEAGVEEALSQLNPGYIGTNINKAANNWTLGGGFYTAPNLPRNISNGYYRVRFTATVNPVPPVIYSTGFTKVPITGDFIFRAVQVGTIPARLFPAGVVVVRNADLNGNTIKIDSFDSADDTKSTGGRYDPAKRQANGDIATPNGVLDIGNAKIYGKIHTTPGAGLPVTGPNVSVGDIQWIDVSGNKGIKPGWVINDMNKRIDDVREPYASGLPPNGPVTVNGTNYTYGIGTGDYYLSGDLKDPNANNKPASIIVSAGATATIYVTGNVKIDNLVMGADAKLKLFVGTPSGSDVTIDLQRLSNLGRADDLQIYGLPSVKDITLGGNDELTALLYAPQAGLTVNGGGSKPYDYQGAIVVRDFTANGQFDFHFDEDLSRNGPIIGFVPVSWKEL